MTKLLVRYTLLWSFFLGALLAILIFQINKKPMLKKESFEGNYEKWFQEKGLKREKLEMDEVRYGTDRKLTEAQFLRNHISLLCVLLVRKRKNAVAANNTWARNCNDIRFIYLQNEKVQKTMLPIRQEKIESSWHLLCEAIRKIPSKFQWVLFLKDDMMAIPENIRYMVASLDPNEGHYLGHPISFWGTTYNIGQAGYVLSRGSVAAIQKHFNTTAACIAGGRFWKQEDFYLGKHLSTLNIHPSDTRDSSGLSTFHGFNLYQLLFPGSLREFSNYYKYAIYPSECCSPFTVTFQSIESDKMYTWSYMMWTVQVFSGHGQRGNRPAPRPKSDTEVWRKFLKEQGVEQDDVSAEQYYQLWKNIVDDPVRFNQDIRSWMNGSAHNGI